MGAFIDALRRALGGGPEAPSAEQANPRHARLDDAYDTLGDEDSGHPEYPGGRVVAADPRDMAAPPKTNEYDRVQWRRKLKRILEKLPASQSQWPDLIAEAGALGFDHAWVEDCQRAEFALMVRRIVSDRVFSLEEHHKLELARDLIGIPEAEAEATLQGIVAEAEKFFGGPIEGA